MWILALCIVPWPYFLRHNIESQGYKKIEEACKDVNVSIEYRDGEQIVVLNGENVNSFLRTESREHGSATSVNKTVRLKLVELQRSLAMKENVVMDGRDIGTYVLPDAALKIYLTASATVRAKRRYLELQKKEFHLILMKSKRILSNGIIARYDKGICTTDTSRMRFISTAPI